MNDLINDLYVLSCAYAGSANLLLNLFFQKWEPNTCRTVRSVVASFKKEWCNEKHKRWTAGEDPESVMCTNGLEATNKVIKDDVTDHQLLPVIEFFERMLNWLEEISYKWDPNNPHHIPFASVHTHNNAEFALAYAWTKDTKKQLRFIEAHNSYVTVVSSASGDLTDAKALRLLEKFVNVSWTSFNEFTATFHHVHILDSDNSRPEGYNCTCRKNAKEFTCVHSLGVALIRGTMVPPQGAYVQLLGRQMKRGRRPQAAPAWERQRFDILSPVQHPQQDPDVLAGNGANRDLGDDLI
jgi:hypothetical protein